MKKILLSLLCVSFIFSSCENDKDGAETEKNESAATKTCIYSFDDESSTLKWTAFKTTDKIAVGGTFDRYDLYSKVEANDINELISTTKFAIQGKSINSANPARDLKLVDFFFGNTEDDGIMKGSVGEVKGEMITFLLTFNSVTLKAPFKYTIKDDLLTLNGSIDLNDFKAEKALSSLNEACKDLHKAADGISKTWPDIDIVFTSKIVKTCE